MTPQNILGDEKNGFLVEKIRPRYRFFLQPRAMFLLSNQVLVQDGIYFVGHYLVPG